MRFHLFFSLAFISGIHGFALFAPYLVSMLLLAYMIASRRMAVAKRVVDSVSVEQSDGRFPMGAMPSIA